MNSDLKQWLADGNHLPYFLKDFHDQKDLFKFIHETYDVDNYYTKDISWAQGQVYVLDYFLYIMGKSGYTLQKCRAKKQFVDLRGELDKFEEMMRERFATEFLKK